MGDELIEWMQDVNTLHRALEILYVVDGYTVTITCDDYPISPAYKGETLLEALILAKNSYDLKAPHKGW